MQNSNERRLTITGWALLVIGVLTMIAVGSQGPVMLFLGLPSIIVGGICLVEVRNRRKT
jgi:hypothetical protein